ncbi:hypothetical protein [Atopobacter sp. AH10]|nr:hypothetical protein [Atopobacter sp. AH10]
MKISLIKGNIQKMGPRAYENLLEFGDNTLVRVLRGKMAAKEENDG